MSFLQIIPTNNQTNYDLCLQAYGSLDLFIKFCKDNEITDAEITKKTPYIYDSDLVIDKNISGYKYSTKSN